MAAAGRITLEELFRKYREAEGISSLVRKGLVGDESSTMLIPRNPRWRSVAPSGWNDVGWAYAGKAEAGLPHSTQF